MSPFSKKSSNKEPFPTSNSKKRGRQLKKLLKSRMNPESPEGYEKAGKDLEQYRGEELNNLVREYMKSSDEVIRLRACSLLSDFCKEGDNTAVPDLIRALGDNSESVMWAAVKGLGNSGMDEAIGPIINAVRSNYLNTSFASDALKKIDPEKASRLLKNNLEDDSLYRYEWAGMLVLLNDVSAVPLLKKHLDRGDFDAYDKGSIFQFVDSHRELLSETEQQNCVICNKKRPVTEMKEALGKWFCTDICWEKRGTLLPTGIGTDCPFFKEGICTAGSGDLLCSLEEGRYSTDCHVYQIYK